MAQSKNYMTLPKEMIFPVGLYCGAPYFLPPEGFDYPGETRRLLEANRNRLVIVDEAYVDFGAESSAALIGEFDNLLVVQTMSKSRSLAGARIGFALGNASLIADLNQLFRLCARIVGELISRDKTSLLSADVYIHFGRGNAYDYTVHLFVCI